MWTISGTLRSTPLPWWSLICNIAPPQTRICNGEMSQKMPVQYELSVMYIFYQYGRDLGSRPGFIYKTSV